MSDRDERNQRGMHPGGGLRHAPAIALGGALGASLRHAIGSLSSTSLPFEDPLLAALAATALINATGSFALGVIHARAEAGHAPSWLRPFLGVGMLGAFTTYSALIQQTTQVAATSGLGSSALLWGGTIGVGLLAFETGRGRFAEGEGKARP